MNCFLYLKLFWIQRWIAFDFEDVQIGFNQDCSIVNDYQDKIKIKKSEFKKMYVNAPELDEGSITLKYDIW